MSIFCLNADQKDPEWLAQIRKPGAVFSWLNPFATFQQSIISSGHAQYLGPIDLLSHDQRQGLLKFVTYVQYARLSIDMIVATHAMSILLNKPKYKGVANLEFVLCAIGFYYLYELKDFKEKINKEKV
jgi:hypothetical protein